MFAEAISGIALGGAGVLAYAVRSPRSSLLAPSWWRGSGRETALSLSFDDGPSEGTAKLLEVLAREGVRVTFFFCGANVRRLPAVAREAVAAGHEVGNHSDTHPNFAFAPASRMRAELGRAQQTLEDLLGVRCRLFRPPYGVRWFGMREVLRELDLRCVLWSVLGRDWKWESARVARCVLRGVFPGAVVCLHDGRELRRQPDVSGTIDAVRQVIPALRERGFQFRTVSELIWPRN